MTFNDSHDSLMPLFYICTNLFPYHAYLSYDSSFMVNSLLSAPFHVPDPYQSFTRSLLPLFPYLSIVLIVLSLLATVASYV